MGVGGNHIELVGSTGSASYNGGVRQLRRADRYILLSLLALPIDYEVAASRRVVVEVEGQRVILGVGRAEQR